MGTRVRVGEMSFRWMNSDIKRLKVHEVSLHVVYSVDRTLSTTGFFILLSWSFTSRSAVVRHDASVEDRINGQNSRSTER